MKILVYSTQEIEKPAITEWLENHKDVELTLESEPLTVNTYHKAEGFDGVCIQQSISINDEEVYENLAKFGIKQIALRTAGHDIINKEFAKKHNLLITNVPAYSPNAIAELACTQTMNLVRKMYLVNQKVANNDFSWKGLIAPEIRSLTVGVIGVSHIGGVYAKLMNGLGAKVIGYDVRVNEEVKDIVEFKNSLEELLNEADVVSIHAPLLESTKHMINSTTIAQMKDNAYLINTARGGIVNTEDLITALKSKKLAGAALDTVEGEVGIFGADWSEKEITDQNLKTLLEMENVLITPHIGFFTQTAVKNMLDIGLNSTYEVITTGTSVNLVK